jgi:hypothetical protein
MRGLPLLLAVPLAACGDGGARDDAPGDAAPVADASVAAPDAAPAGCRCDAVEDCDACMANIGRCCYGDPAVMGQVARLAAACEANPKCAVCCAECAAKPCERLRADGECPNEEPPLSP